MRRPERQREGIGAVKLFEPQNDRNPGGENRGFGIGRWDGGTPDLRSSYPANGTGIGVVPQTSDQNCDRLPTQKPPGQISIGDQAVSALSTNSPADCLVVPPTTEAKMRVIIPTLVGLVALASASVQAAPIPTKPNQHAKWHETPAQNVRKSRQYDYLVATNSSFRAYRMRKECGPIRDPELRANCLSSFSVYEPR